MKRTELDMLFVILGMAMVLAPTFFNLTGLVQYVLFVGGVLVAAYAGQLAKKVKGNN